MKQPMPRCSHGRTKSGGSGGFGVGGGGGGGGGALAQPPGSVYRSPELFENLWPFMEDDSNRSYNAAVELTKFDYRLSNKLDVDLQKLRCRVNYHALKFTDPILEMGKKLVERMRMKSKHFIALHLRFESDMLAFSGCYYGGGDKERTELGALRKRWKTLHIRNPDKERRQGKCPLTPEEVGLMLRAWLILLFALNSLWVKKMSIRQLIDGWDKGMRKQLIPEFSD